MSWAVKKRPRRELLPSVQLSNTVDLNFTQKASLPPEEDWSLEMKDEAQTFQEADSVPYSFRTYDHLVSDLHIAIRTCAEMLQVRNPSKVVYAILLSSREQPVLRKSVHLVALRVVSVTT